MPETSISIFWFRRDLRLHDNAGFFHALRSGHPVLPLFIFDKTILGALQDRDDARVTFIHDALQDLNKELNKYGSSLLVLHDKPLHAFKKILSEQSVEAVYTNTDYEPYAALRDEEVRLLLDEHNIGFNSFKDQVIFEKDEVLKDDGTPYTVFSAYKRKWMENLRPAFHLKSYPTEKYASEILNGTYPLPSLNDLGFRKSALIFPDKEYRSILKNYGATRDFPAIKGTSQVSVHLRFGTLSVRDLARDAFSASDKTWLNELIWRDFYAMILYHFPHSATGAVKKEYDQITWRNNEAEFNAWCEGKTGYPLVDAGMRQLNATGWMHNRVRMVTASFLSKHLLIDWRWGEAYFARKLIDYDMASNVGGWQWAAGSGNDAAPYFRVFNPELQSRRFDPEFKYVKRWVPEFHDPFVYPKPIVDHKEARERALKVYGDSLAKAPRR